MLVAFPLTLFISFNLKIRLFFILGLYLIKRITSCLIRQSISFLADTLNSALGVLILPLARSLSNSSLSAFSLVDRKVIELKKYLFRKLLKLVGVLLVKYIVLRGRPRGRLVGITAIVL